jgi:hypothetical protein
LSYQLPLWVWPTALMAVCTVAVWRGRDDERLAAAALLANWAISILVVRAGSGSTHWEVFFVDAALLGLYLWLALRTQRHWPLFAAGFQLLVVATHIGRAVDPTVSGWAYLTAGIIWSYLVLFSIGYGAWTAPRYALSADDPTEEPGATRR